MKAVIYARCALQEKDENIIKKQINECLKYAKENNITITEQYIDNGFSGTNSERPAFQKMIEDSKNQKFQAVIVYQLDRFARNRYDSAIYKQKLRKNGVKVISTRENISDDASWILMESVLEGMAEYYSQELSQKIKAGIARKKKENNYFSQELSPKIKAEILRKKKEKEKIANEG